MTIKIKREEFNLIYILNQSECSIYIKKRQNNYFKFWKQSFNITVYKNLKKMIKVKI